LVRKIIHSKTSMTINSKYDLSMEKQFNATHQWRNPFIVVYKRLAYLRGMLFSLLLNYSKLNCYGV
jgi:hypothetical protein